MKKFTFHSGPYIPQAKYLFNQYEHLQLQDKKHWRCFYLLDESEACQAFIWLNIQDGIASSPLKAPFGSFEYKPTVSIQSLFEFIDYILNTLTAEGIKKIIIKQSPDAYEHPKRCELNSILMNLGYTITKAEIGSIIPVQQTAYDTLLNDWEQRKLRQAKENNFAFTVADKASLANIYQFIRDCRDKKGYELSMPLQDLQLLRDTFPDAIKLFVLRNESDLIAACISIQVSHDILYTFYYDHASAYKQYSPVVMLMEGIYDYCQQNQCRLLDLGTAYLNGKPNFSLLTFKQHLGSQPTSKFTFEKILNHD